ncbi:MAG: isoleucine--tRNA ligase [Brevinemataceae bacterium]
MNQKTQKHNFPVNLPTTKFDMRAGLVQKEPLMINEWEQKNIYQKRSEKRQKAEKFIFHDGPPYANGDIHIGTALNKILKDIICRNKYMEGFNTPFIPGWDCHGLPIELNTLKQLGKTADSLSPVEIRQKSREYAAQFVEKQKNSFIRLGICADWNAPYLTMSNDYEASIIEAFGILAEKNYIYRGQRPIHWSPDTQTALADAEVEYHNHTSPAIYVMFPIQNCSEVNLPENSYVLIWTTTPWTLPANTALAFHPDAVYEAITLSDGRTFIIAEELKSNILSLTDAKETASKILTSKNLETLSVMHPWINRNSKIVFADYVTMDSGTGIVHTAPGHGTDDFYTGLKYNLDILCPVDNKGRFTSEVPEWEGEKVFDANPKIIEFLKTHNKLFYYHDINHSYPHDWRTKTPIIFRTLPQWFIKVSDSTLTTQALQSLPNIRWIPGWGEDRLKNMIANRPDWCISRQRKWGVPIPVFYCSQCSHPIVDKKIIFHIADRVRKEGLNFWLEHDAETILPNNYSCPKCHTASFVKEEDILDVWFDSGVSHYAVLEKNSSFPADLYFEGNDQYRGWFQSSLWTSIGINSRPPFKSVVTHGWVLDEQGRQMHKSTGNSVSPSEITDKFGADILRLWTVTEDYTKDLRIGDNIIQKTIDLYRKLRNTFRYLLGSLSDFTFENRMEYKHLTTLDQYILHRLSRLKQKFHEHTQLYQFQRAYREIFNFIIVDLSGEYFDILKDRLYILTPNDPNRRSAQTVLSYLLEELTLMMAPTLVFTCEEVYSYFPVENKAESVHLLEYIPICEEWINPTLSEEFKLLYNIREDVLKNLQILRNSNKIGSSLEADICLSCPQNIADILSKHLSSLKEILIVSEITIEMNNKITEISITASSAKDNGKKKCERCWHMEKEIHNNLCSRCAEILSNL